jgi:hypothetical protein
MAYGVFLVVCLGFQARADVSNEAVATGSYDGATVVSEPVRAVVDTAPVVPSLSITSTGQFADDDGIGGISPGDAAEFAVTIVNTGNTVLRQIAFDGETDQSGKLQTPLQVPEQGTADLGVGERREVVLRYPLTRENIEDNGDLNSIITVSAVSAGLAIRERTFASVDIPPIQGVEPDWISLTAATATSEAGPGDRVEISITAFNRATSPLTTTLSADLAPGFEFIDETVVRGDEPVVPIVDGGRLVIGDFDIPAEGHATISIPVVATATLEPGVHATTAAIEDPVTGIALAPAAEVLVRSPGSEKGACAGLSIFVFDDDNHDQIADESEPGIPGVRLAPAIGLPMTTGVDGRYTSPCATVSRLGGVDIEMELDPDTLPDGYFVTTANPLRVRVGRGEIAEMQFGAATARIVRIDLNAAAFQHSTTVPDTVLSEDITRLVSVLDQQPSQVRLTYHAYDETDSLPVRRLEAVRDLIQSRWASAGASYPLVIDTRIAEGG